MVEVEIDILYFSEFFCLLKIVVFVSLCFLWNIDKVIIFGLW